MNPQPFTRPEAPTRPCPACGNTVEPLRAGAVMLLEDGFRYFCDADCRSRFRSGERAFDAARGAPALTTKTGTEVSGTRETHRGTPSSPAIRRAPDLRPLDSRAHRAVPDYDPIGPPWAGIGAMCVALVLGAFPAYLTLAVLSTLASISAAVIALVMAWPARREVGWLVWAIGPGGAILAATAALVARLEDPNAWPLIIGAAIAAGAMVARAWLDARACQPVDLLVRDLLCDLPATVKIPAPDAPTPRDARYEVVAAARVRTGEDVITLEGEIVCFDGVIKAGEAYALLHPGARTPVRRVAGDALLAGARIVEGGVRTLVTRVGDDRGLRRPARFGRDDARDGAPTARLANRIARWGGLAAFAFAISGLWLAGEWSAAAAVLLAAPLLSVRRGVEAPLVAAAATAGGRGIVFQSARALDAAGRVAVAALSTHGTVTEGEPEVVEIHSVDGTPVNTLIALAAAAEAAAEGRPIARAILRFAEGRGIAPESVRRAAYLPGRGVTALGPGGEAIAIGNRQLLLDEGISVAAADAEAARAEGRGHTAIFIGVGGRVRAVISLQDGERPGARAAVQRLIDLQVEVVLISGDHRPTVETLARSLDIQHVKAELLPEERGTEVQRLGETGGTVAAIGRPEDDAMLAAADVPVVLGAAGGPAGERAIALATDDVRDAAAALWIARACRREILRSLAMSLGGGGLVVTIAAFGVAPPALAALAALAVDAFALPTALRLLRRIDLRLPARS